MDIRKDFESAATYLQRLAGIGEVFVRYNLDTWPHLKNNEDFRKIYNLPEPLTRQFEQIYMKGRDCAYFMGSRLREFNDVGQFPTFSMYVDSFESTWAYGHVDLQHFIEKIRESTASQETTPWAVGRMVEVFDDQLMLLKAVRETVELLRTTNLYRIEKGEVPVEKEHRIHIGQITGRVNINSIDNSTNTVNDSSSVFSRLRNAIENSDIDTLTKVCLLQGIESMRETNGSPTFSEKYKDFVQQAANHMTIIAPFIPSLTLLIS